MVQKVQEVLFRRFNPSRTRSMNLLNKTHLNHVNRLNLLNLS